MATTLIFGAEMQALGEGVGASGVTFSTSIKRSGAASMRNFNAAGNIPFSVIPSGGVATAFFQSCSVWIYIVALPNVAGLIASSTGGSSSTGLTLNPDGTLKVADGSGVGPATSTNAFTADATWHLIDVDASGSTRTVYVDGVQWVQATGLTAAAPATSFTLGYSGIGTTVDIYFDDLVVDDGSISSSIGKDHHALLLIPTAGNNAGGWTNGAGGTGDIHGSVANIPPVGVAASTAAAKIKNATSTTTGDYVATMQSYSVAGVPAGSTVNAVQSICSSGQEVTTGGGKPGGIWVASNPAQSATGTSFDCNNAGVVEGTYPTGWSTNRGVVAVGPTVTLATAPTVTVRKNLASTRVEGICFMGLYVDYTPPPAPPIGKIVAALQAVNRASTY